MTPPVPGRRPPKRPCGPREGAISPKCALDFVTCVYYCYQMSVKRLLLFLLLAFFVFFMIQAPNEAARLVKSTGESAGEWFSNAGEAFTEFLKSLA